MLINVFLRKVGVMALGLFLVSFVVAQTESTPAKTGEIPAMKFKDLKMLKKWSRESSGSGGAAVIKIGLGETDIYYAIRHFGTVFDACDLTFFYKEDSGELRVFLYFPMQGGELHVMKSDEKISVKMSNHKTKKWLKIVEFGPEIILR